MVIFHSFLYVYQRVYLLEDAFQNASEQQNHPTDSSTLRARTLQSRRQGQSEEKKWILKVVWLCFQSRTRRKKIHLVLEYICACCWKYVELYLGLQQLIFLQNYNTVEERNPINHQKGWLKHVETL